MVTKTKRFFFSVISLLFILAGCVSKGTQNSSSVLHTATIERTLDRTSPTNEPTHTPRPTLTREPTLLPTRTPPFISVATLNAKATLETSEELCNEFESDSSRSSEISPDGEWFAISCGYKRNQKLIVQNQEGTKWVFNFADSLGPHFQGPGTFKILAWSSDGRFLYLSKVLGYSGGGNQCFPGFGAHGLFRLHLETGTLITLVPSSNWFPGDEIRFSPANEYYAIDIDGVRITNLVSGEVISIDSPDVMEMSWSPDGRFLAFSVASCGETLVESSSILVWNSSTNQTQVLFSTEEMLLRPQSWINNSTLRFEGETWVGDNNLYTLFEYDLAVDAMIFSGTATPRP
jgi:hypothetical protein